MKKKGEISVSVREKEVLRYLGYKKGQTEIGKNVTKIIGNVTEKIKSYHAKYSCVTYSIRVIKDGVLIKKPGFVISNVRVKELLKNSSFVTVMSVTLGDEIEKFIKGMFLEDRYTEATVADAAGSEAVENAADKLSSFLEKEAKQTGYHITRRFSPGYGGWDLTVQETLLKLSGGKNIGIRVTKESMLVPRKSITAIVGWQRKKETAKVKKVKCKQCNMSVCQFKRGVIDEKNTV